MTNSQLKSLIRTIPDFPKPGIKYRDITTLLLNPAGLDAAVAQLVEKIKPFQPTKIVAIESRGFIFGGAVARSLSCGLALARKRGKLPADVERVEYQLEYGTDCVELHRDAIAKGDRCIVVDDLLATGGTCNAVCQLIERLEGKVAGCGFVINLPYLEGTNRLRNYNPFWIMEFLGDEA